MKLERLNKDEIKELLEEIGRPVDEYKDLNRPDLIAYAKEYINEDDLDVDVEPKLNPVKIYKVEVVAEDHKDLKKGKVHEVSGDVAMVLIKKGLIKVIE